MAKDTETTAIAVVEQVQRQLAEIGELGDVIAENLGGDRITSQQLTRIRIPSGGGMAWSYPTEDGPRPREAFEGVILHRQKARAFWRTALDQGNGNAPPDCRSDDAIIGIGDPGGACETCPFAQFGSKLDARGQATNAQACKALELLYVLVPGELLPAVVVAPPTSLRSVRDYMFRLTSSRRRAYWTVVTRFGLEQAKSGSGITYSRLALSPVADLDEPSTAAVADARQQMAPLFGTVEVGRADVD